MAEEMIDLIALYEEHRLILTTLHGAGIIESDEWHVICMFLDNLIVLENIKAIQAVEKLEAELSHQGAKSGKRSSTCQQNKKKDPRSTTPREPILSPEFIAHRVNRCQWFVYPHSD